MASAIDAAVTSVAIGTNPEAETDHVAEMGVAPPRPFKVLGIQQIALGALEREKLRALWVDRFGLEPAGDYRSERENVIEDICTLGTGALKVEVDLMQPLDPQGRPAVHLPPLNHVGLWIDDLPRAVAWLSEQGVRFAPGGIRKGASGHDICFVHPKANVAFPIAGEGVLIELVQAPPAIISAYAALAAAGALDGVALASSSANNPSESVSDDGT